MAATQGGGSVLLQAHDVELAAPAAGGDRRAFSELVRRHGSAIRGLLRWMGADAARADDVAQEAFLAAYEQIADFRGEGSSSHAWVRRRPPRGPMCGAGGGKRSERLLAEHARAGRCLPMTRRARRGRLDLDQCAF